MIRYRRIHVGVPARDTSEINREAEKYQSRCVGATGLDGKPTQDTAPVRDLSDAVLRGLMYIVNLNDNSYEFYEVINETKVAGEEWDEPPNYPGITNAYYTVVELGKNNILDISVIEPANTPAEDDSVADDDMTSASLK